MGRFRTFSLVVALACGSAAHAADSALILGKASYNANCAICHGEDGTGNGTTAELFKVPPSDLTTLSERNGGAFPFSEVYKSIASGLGVKAHGDSEMPIWGGYFVADTLADRNMSEADAEQIVQGRILSLVYFLESIQK
ncbi:c-type cytochrome [Lutimaribacter saemankumensis]|uniref:Cytochrome C oxidase, cbb3-type, subunit III n=1 Tax=Lutimaribacter saemankumensis TaxID=490829 RepID=A0A1G8T4P4_9RHOB|nr:c-type cytochrome [Lutimaribacter saemankumensis]SDJ36453.1 Cytochrome C oxidase, cbb3-type, subunit III [Lutimaribacter saemankumensis]